MAAFVVVDRGEIDFDAEGSDGLPPVFRIADGGGRVLAETGWFDWEGDVPVVRFAGDEHWSDVELVGDADGMAVTIGVEPRTEEGQELLVDDATKTGPIVAITVAGSRASVDWAVAGVTAAIVGTGAIVLMTTATIVWWGVRTGLRPLDRLAGQLAEVRTENLGPLPSGSRMPSELRPVCAALDHLLSRIREALERQRRFTDAAAHELRTPIAELRTTIDVARRWPEPERMTVAIERADVVVGRMGALIDALLLLGRTPNDFAGEGIERTAVTDAVRAEVDRIADKAAAKDIAVGIDLPPGGEWSLPDAAGVMIFRNLLSNALEYTPAGGRIDVILISPEPRPELRVTNGPVDLDESRIGRLFEPFWRAEGSRSNQDHHGLGLAVVRHVCEACGLSCIASLENGALTISVRADDPTENRGGSSRTQVRRV